MPRIRRILDGYSFSNKVCTLKITSYGPSFEKEMMKFEENDEV